ncbi:MAG TPA: hypothetical protein PKY64_08715 [Anaerolineaceae bacterium]|nr:hypothetical protein [Anaerolineaceae bacterium]
MKTRRFFFFFLAILIGAGAGLAFGWTMMPPAAPTDAPLASLRTDFKTDLVLMVAEEFQTEPDSMQALTQLDRLDESDPITLLGNSIQYAQGIGYPEEDLTLMQNLLNSIDAEIYLQWNDTREP